MQTRPWWKQTSTFNSIFNFRWQQSSQGIKYDRLTGLYGIQQVVNHFPNHKDLSDKSNLINNLKLYCETKKQLLFDITPVTFVVDLQMENAEMELLKFASFFIKNQPKSKKTQTNKKILADWKKKIKSLIINPNQDKYIKIQNEFSKPKMHVSYSEGQYYLWLLKPSDLNRGRGIQLFDSLVTLEKLLNELKVGTAEYGNIQEYEQQLQEQRNQDNDQELQELLQQKQYQQQQQQQQQQSLEDNENAKDKVRRDEKKNSILKIKSQEFVIQKYIQKPMLIDGRKFDIRVWVLISHQMNCYLFKEGYLRTSCEKFSLDNLDNAFVHLTNNAIQKQSSSYGQFESGNQLSYSDFDQILKDFGFGDAFRDKILPQIRNHITTTLLAVRKNFCAKEIKYCYEIFGYDFIIDNELNTWLIEVNTNPCIEESSNLLKSLVPRMINDAFKLTIDQIFPKIKNRITKQKIENISPSLGDIFQEQEASQKFQVLNYKDEENLWEFLLSLQQQPKKQK